MREWIPVPSSAKGRMATRALEAFGRAGYTGVAVGDLAAAAGVTTGSLYHHFGSKLGLYAIVRTEVERRVLDRMRGAAAARADDPRATVVRAAVLVGFDHAAGNGFARLLAEPHPDRPGDLAADPVEELVVELAGDPLGRLVTAAWRAALLAVADGRDPAALRAALAGLLAT